MASSPHQWTRVCLPFFGGENMKREGKVEDKCLHLIGEEKRVRKENEKKKTK